MTFAWECIVGIVLGRIPNGILYMHMHDPWLYVSIELPGILFGPRLGLGSVLVENRIGGVKNPFKAGNIFQKLQGKRPAHAAVVHAVFMDGLNSGAKEP